MSKESTDYIAQLRAVIAQLDNDEVHHDKEAMKVHVGELEKVAIEFMQYLCGREMK